MAEKKISTRVQLKREFAYNWRKAPDFIPLEGEIIVYKRETADTSTKENPVYLTTTDNGSTVSVFPIPGEQSREAYEHNRFKIGDGFSKLSELPFVDLTKTEREKLDKIAAEASNVIFTRTLETGTKIGTIIINGVSTDLYSETLKLYDDLGTSEDGAMTQKATTNAINDLASAIENSKAKTQTEAQWSADKTIYTAGQILVYSTDASHSTPRFKVSDGSHVANDLPFVGAEHIITLGDKSYGSGYGESLVGKSFDIPVLGSYALDGLSFLNTASSVSSGATSIKFKISAYNLIITASTIYGLLEDLIANGFNGGVLEIAEQLLPITNLILETVDKTIFDEYYVTAVVADGYAVGSTIPSGTAPTNIHIGAAVGEFAGAFGNKPLALGKDSFVEGNLSRTTVAGVAAHAEGVLTSAEAAAAHTEGSHTLANAQAAHAEGYQSIASGAMSHAEGYKTEATADNAHAEGNQAKATAASAHAEGYQTQATKTSAHAEGNGSTAEGAAAHAEGGLTHAYADYAHTEGKQAEVSSEAIAAHAEGNNTKAKGQYSHAEGSGSQAIAEAAHAEGLNTVATGRATHTEGYKTSALGEFSHAEGSNTVTGKLEDDGVTITGGKNAHAEGYKTTASGNFSHAEGSTTVASGIYSHASGANSQANGTASFAAGNTTIASGAYSATFGNQTKAGQGNQFVVGKFNDNKANTIFEVGIGSKENETDESGNITTKNRKNAFEVYTDGHAELAKQGTTDNSVLIKSGIKTINNQSIIGAGNIEIKPSVNPDWNQSDEAAPDYIKNKTHGTITTQEAINIAEEDYENDYYKIIDRFMSIDELIGCKVTYAHEYSGELPSYYTVEITSDMITNIEVSPEFAAAGAVALVVNIDSRELICVYSIPDGLDLPDGAPTTGVYAAFITEAGLEHSGAGVSPDTYYWVSKFEFPEVIKKLDEKYLPETKTINGESIFGEGDIGTDLGVTAKMAELTIKLPDKCKPDGFDSGSIFLSNNIDIRGPLGVSISGNGTIDINSSGNHISLNPQGGNVNLCGNNLVGAKVVDPTEALDIANKQYVDAHSVGKSIDGVTSGEIFNDYNNNNALGNYSHAEGKNTKASGYGSHAEGVQTEAYNDASHAEGFKTVAGDVDDATTDYAHAEGKETKALGAQSHAEGSGTTAKGISAHAEGHKTQALGIYSHTGGYKTIAKYDNQTVVGQCNLNKADTLFEVGNGTGESDELRSNAFEVYSDGHAEIQAMGETDNSVATKAYVDSHSGSTGSDVGKTTENNGEIFNDYNNNIAGYLAHAEGLNTTASGNQSHTEGQSTTASGASSHAEGYGATASGDVSHAEGNSTATAEYSHAEGFNTQATAIWAHSEGASTKATANAAHAEGSTAEAHAYAAHAEGQGKAYLMASHAEGNSITGTIEDIADDSLAFAHAEGRSTQAFSIGAHSEGRETKAIGMHSHAEGYKTEAHGIGSHAAGYKTKAIGDYSSAHGYYTLADYHKQAVFGQYNDNKEDTIFEIGIGAGETAPENAFEVYTDGKVAMLSLDVDASSSYLKVEHGGISMGSMNGISIDAAGGLDIVANEFSLAKYNGSEIATMDNLIGCGTTLPTDTASGPKFFVLI